MVTGGGGSIGSELCRQILKFKPSKLLVLDINENNCFNLEQELKNSYPDAKTEYIIASIRDKERIDEIFKTKKPELVFHAAAHKHVPLMENNPGEAIKNNILGTYNVAQSAGEHGVLKFILISTDKAVNPTNVMGASKRVCEMVIKALNPIYDTNYAAVRFGNVLGSSGSVVPLFKKQIETTREITLTHKNITRFFMTIPEAAQLVLEAGAYSKGGEVFVLDMGEPVKIYDLAINLILLSGLTPHRDVKIKITGLRPGEKLYEEILMAEEGLIPAPHKKIFITKFLDVDINKLNEDIKSLKAAAENADKESIKELLKKIVPTYKCMENNDETNLTDKKDDKNLDSVISQ